MSYRFTLATIMATITLTGCAKHQTAGTPEEFVKGSTQVNVSHVLTRADDGSSIFLTVDGKDVGPLLPGKNTELHIPAGKHQVGGYAQTLLGLGRVTIQSVEVTTRPGEITQLAYSVTRNKPVFANVGVTKIPVEPAAAPAQSDESAVVTPPVVDAFATATAGSSDTDNGQNVTAQSSPAYGDSAQRSAQSGTDTVNSAQSTTAQLSPASGDSTQRSAQSGTDTVNSAQGTVVQSSPASGDSAQSTAQPAPAADKSQSGTAEHASAPATGGDQSTAAARATPDDKSAATPTTSSETSQNSTAHPSDDSPDVKPDNG